MQWQHVWKENEPRIQVCVSVSKCLFSVRGERYLSQPSCKLDCHWHPFAVDIVIYCSHKLRSVHLTDGSLGEVVHLSMQTRISWHLQISYIGSSAIYGAIHASWTIKRRMIDAMFSRTAFTECPTLNSPMSGHGPLQVLIREKRETADML